MELMLDTANLAEIRYGLENWPICGVTSNPSILKKEGDELFSGSFIVSGNCLGEAIHVGADNYASKIANEAKYIKKVNFTSISKLTFLFIENIFK